MTQQIDDQIQRIMAYASFDATIVYANCEECGAKIPVALTLCDACEAATC